MLLDFFGSVINYGRVFLLLAGFTYKVIHRLNMPMKFENDYIVGKGTKSHKKHILYSIIERAFTLISDVLELVTSKLFFIGWKIYGENEFLHSESGAIYLLL